MIWKEKFIIVSGRKYIPEERVEEAIEECIGSCGLNYGVPITTPKLIYVKELLKSWD